MVATRFHDDKSAYTGAHKLARNKHLTLTLNLSLTLTLTLALALTLTRCAARPSA